MGEGDIIYRASPVTPADAVEFILDFDALGSVDVRLHPGSGVMAIVCRSAS